MAPTNVDRPALIALIGRRTRSASYGAGIRCALLLCGLSILALAPSASAGTLGQRFRVSENASPRSATDPSLAFDGHRERFLAVWAAETTTGGNTNKRILGRFISDNGVPLGHQFQVSQLSTANSFEANSDPAIVYNSRSREFLVVWHGVRDTTCDSSSAGTRILGQRLSETGRRVGPREFSISNSANPEQQCVSDPNVAYNAEANEYFVVWATTRAPGTSRPSGSAWTVRARPWASELPDLADLALGNRPRPHLRSDSRAVPGRLGGRGIDGQRLTETGAKVGPASFHVGGGPSAVHASATFNTETRQFLVVFKSSGGEDSAVRGQRLNESGQQVGTSDFLVSEPTLLSAGAPTVAGTTRAVTASRSSSTPRRGRTTRSSDRT